MAAGCLPAAGSFLRAGVQVSSDSSRGRPAFPLGGQVLIPPEAPMGLLLFRQARNLRKELAVRLEGMRRSPSGDRTYRLLAEPL